MGRMRRLLRGACTLPLTAGFALACAGSSAQPRVATTPAAAPNAISFGVSDRLIGVPIPTDGRYSVRVYGAKGDGVTIDSDAINRAIDAAAAAGGGTVVFPAGTYASHSIRLKSHVGLHLDQGAVLLAADTGGGRGYDPAERGPGNAFQDFGHSHWHNSLIWGENLEDVSITGPGRIDGKGLSRGLGGRAEDLDTRPGQANKAIALKRSRNVLLRDFTIHRGGHMSILLTGVDLRAVGGPINLNFTGSTRADLIRLNTGIAPTAPAGSGNRLGVLAGDLAGFPNGRRLEDDVTDIELRAFACGYGTVVGPVVQALGECGGNANRSPNNLLGDGVDRNDRPFHVGFPYAGEPHQGYEHVHHSSVGGP